MAAVADRVIVELEARLGRYEADLRRAAQNFERGQAQTRAAILRTENQIRKSSGSMRDSLKSVAAGFTGIAGVAILANLADSYTRFTNQLKISGLEGRNLAKVQAELFAVAQRNGTELETLGGLYGRLSAAQKELGLSTGDLMSITRSVAAAVRIQGGAASEARGAIIQLTQALGGEIVRAEEFNSINEGARPILQAVAREIDKYGGSVARLRRDVIEGKVASADFAAALVKATDALEAQARKAPLTLGQSFQVLNNALGQYIGQTDQALSITQRISAGIATLAENIDTVANALAIIAVALASRYAAGLVLALGRTVALTAANVRMVQTFNAGAASLVAGGVATQASMAAAAAGVTRMSVAMGTAGAMAAGLGRGLLAAFGGPVGLAIGAIALGIYYYSTRTQEARVTTDELRESLMDAETTLQQVNNRGKAAADAIRQTGERAARSAVQMRDFAGATGDAAKQLAELATKNKAATLEQIHNNAEQLRAQRDSLKNELGDLLNARGAGDRGPIGGVKAGYIGEQTPREREILATLGRLNSTIGRLETAYTTVRKGPLESNITEADKARVGGGIEDPDGQLRQITRDLVIARRTGIRAEIQRLEAEQFYINQYKKYRKEGLSPGSANSAAQADRTKFQAGTTTGNTTRDARGRPEYTSREQGATDLIAMARAAGFKPSENFQTGRVGEHPGMGREAHGKYAVDINIPGGENSPEAKAAADAFVRAAQARGFRLLWNGKVYEAGASGPGRNIPAGKDQHRDHIHGEAPQSIIGKARGEAGEAATDIEAQIYAALQEEATRQAAVAQERASLDAELRDARRNLVISADELEALARQDIEAQQAAYNVNLERGVQQGELLQAEADELREMNNRIVALRLQNIERERKARLEREATAAAQRRVELETADLQNQREVLESQSGMLKTANERRAVELQILELQMQEQRLRLRAVIAAAERVQASETANAEEKRAAAAEAEIARRRLGTIEKMAPGQREEVRQRTRGPMEEYRDSLKRTSEQLDEDFQRIAVSGLEAINEQLTDAIMKSESLGDLFDNLGDVFHNVANQIIADLLRIAIQQLIIKPIADLLGAPATGGGGGGGGGFFSTLLKTGMSAASAYFGGGSGGGMGALSGGSAAIGMASGGHVNAGTLYRVNETGVEGFQPSQSGQIIPLGRMNTAANAAGAAGAAGAPAVVRLIVGATEYFDLRVQSVSGNVAVETVQAFAPALTDMAVNETFARANRPTM